MNRANLMGATLLRCLPKDQVPVVEKQLYEHQKKWCYDEKDAYSYLSQLAQENGLDAGNFESCIRNKDIQKNLLSTQEKLSERYGVSRMPTLLIRRGKKVGLWEGADKKEIVDGLDEFLDLHH